MPSEGFIIQTAQDYDMNVEDVRRIVELYPNNFYDELEEFIKDRANRNT